MGTHNIILVTCKFVTCTHFQSGVTALKMAQSEGGHQDVCDILLRYTQHSGSKVIGPEQQMSEARKEEELKRRESEKEGETGGQQQETNTQLTEVRSMHSYMHMTTHWSL